MTPLAYCPTCRTWFGIDANPPYAVMHVPAAPEETPVLQAVEVEIERSIHLHPLTREVLGEEMSDRRQDDGDEDH